MNVVRNKNVKEIKMTKCSVCDKEIKDDEVCFHLEITEANGEHPQDGGIVKSENLCEDCYHQNF